MNYFSLFLLNLFWTCCHCHFGSTHSKSADGSRKSKKMNSKKARLKPDGVSEVQAFDDHFNELETSSNSNKGLQADPFKLYESNKFAHHQTGPSYSGKLLKYHEDVDKSHLDLYLRKSNTTALLELRTDGGPLNWYETYEDSNPVTFWCDPCSGGNNVEFMRKSEYDHFKKMKSLIDGKYKRFAMNSNENNYDPQGEDVYMFCGWNGIVHNETQDKTATGNFVKLEATSSKTAMPWFIDVVINDEPKDGVHEGCKRQDGLNYKSNYDEMEKDRADWLKTGNVIVRYGRKKNATFYAVIIGGILLLLCGCGGRIYYYNMGGSNEY